MTKEIWKDVEGTDFGYQVSNFGDIRCTDHPQKLRIGPVRIHADARGYKRVHLKFNGVVKTIKIHRLVAKAFLPDYSDELTVNHKDFNKSNNRVENLEMMTSRDNALHYQSECVNKRLGCKRIGVKFHTGINKWTARVNHNGVRKYLGAFGTEDDAVAAYDRFIETGDESLFKIGRGVSNRGRSKYSVEKKQEVLRLAAKIGVRKAGKISGAGSTQIGLWRRQVKEGELKFEGPLVLNKKKRVDINGVFVKDK